MPYCMYYYVFRSLQREIKHSDPLINYILLKSHPQASRVNCLRSLDLSYDKIESKQCSEKWNVPLLDYIHYQVVQCTRTNYFLISPLQRVHSIQFLQRILSIPFPRCSVFYCTILFFNPYCFVLQKACINSMQSVYTSIFHLFVASIHLLLNDKKKNTGIPPLSPEPCRHTKL